MSGFDEVRKRIGAELDRCLLQKRRPLARRVKVERVDVQRLAASDELLPRFADVQRHIKRDGSIVTEADHAVQARMQKMLAEHWPQYNFLGEEMSRERHENLTSLPGPGLWCLDPLDGTSNFTAGLPYFCVSLALLVEGLPQVGMVYDPVRDECFMAQRGKVKDKDGEEAMNVIIGAIRELEASGELVMIQPEEG